MLVPANGEDICDTGTPLTLTYLFHSITPSPASPTNKGEGEEFQIPSPLRSQVGV